MNQKEVSRREFLKMSLLTAASLAFKGKLPELNLDFTKKNLSYKEDQGKCPRNYKGYFALYWC